MPRIADSEIAERLTRIEKVYKDLQWEIDKRFEQVDKRFDDINKQFDRLIDIFISIIVAFAAGAAVNIGFAIWDRKTTLKPAMNRVEKLESVLRKYAEKEPRLAEERRNLGLL